MYYVYLIQHTEIKDYYIGYTEDLKSRMGSHNDGENPSTKRKSGKWELIYYEAFRMKQDAYKREMKLKHHGKGKSELLKRLQASIL